MPNIFRKSLVIKQKANDENIKAKTIQVDIFLRKKNMKLS